MLIIIQNCESYHSLGMASGVRKPTQSSDSVLRIRVQELEKQVADYKKRLDELRKAKNTTVYKREREVLEVGAPQLGKKGSADDNGSLLEDLNKQHAAEIDRLNKSHKEEIQQISKSSQGGKCNHEPEIERLKKEVESLGADKAAILIENTDLRQRVDSLVHELSIKEAEWCEMEEQLNHKLKLQWGEKYRDWMTETEKRIEELQNANAMLIQMIRPSDNGGTSNTEKK